MNSVILEVDVYEAMKISFMRRHNALNATLGSFKILRINEIQNLGIHFVNVENLS